MIALLLSGDALRRPTTFGAGARALRLARLTLRSAGCSIQLGLAYHGFALALAVGIFRLMWGISLGPAQASMAATGCFALLTSRALRTAQRGL